MSSGIIDGILSGLLGSSFLTSLEFATSYRAGSFLTSFFSNSFMLFMGFFVVTFDFFGVFIFKLILNSSLLGGRFLGDMFIFSDGLFSICFSFSLGSLDDCFLFKFSILMLDFSFSIDFCCFLGFFNSLFFRF